MSAFRSGSPGIYSQSPSSDSLTCVAVGGKRLENLYIQEVVVDNGKSYRTVAIADDALGGYDIKSVYIPDGVRTIGENAFNQCKQISSLQLPASVERIGNRCFEALENLTNLQLSPSMKEIPHAAFVGCKSLKKVIIPEGVEVIGLDAFAKCDKLREMVLPSTLTTIKRGAFWECRKLREITIPASVTAIGEYVFYECDSLTDVYNLSPVPQTIPPVFNRKNITLHVPKGAEDMYRKADNWNRAKVVAF